MRREVDGKAYFVVANRLYVLDDSFAYLHEITDIGGSPNWVPTITRDQNIIHFTTYSSGGETGAHPMFAFSYEGLALA